jgi:hypothetical protein
MSYKTKKRTIPTDRSLIGEVSANFCGYRVPRGQRDGSLRQYSRLSRPVRCGYSPQESFNNASLDTNATARDAGRIV